MQNNTELKLRILYKILNNFKIKLVKMQYTSVKQMGQIIIFKKKNSMLKRLFLLIHTEQFVFPFLKNNENSSRCILKYYVYTYILLTKWRHLSFYKMILNITDVFSFLLAISFFLLNIDRGQPVFHLQLF